MSSFVISAQVAVAGSGASSDPYVFGVVSNYTTAAGTFSKIAYDGLEARFNYVNDKGGVNKRDIELQKQDIAGDTARLLAGYREFAANQDMLAILGLGQSAQQGAIPPLVQEAKVTTVSFPGGGPALFAGPHDYLWAAQLDIINGIPKAASDFIADDTPKAKVAILGLDTPAMRAGGATFTREIQTAGGSVTASEFLPVTATDAAAAIDKLVATGPDWLLVTGATPGLLQSIVNSIKLKGDESLKLFVMANGAAKGSFDRAATSSYYASTPTVQALDEKNKAAAVIRKAARKYGFESSLESDDTVFTMGWVMGDLLIAALKKCPGECTRDQFYTAFSALGAVKVKGGLVDGMTVDKVNPQIFRTALVLGFDKKTKKAKPVSDFIDLY